MSRSSLAGAARASARNLYWWGYQIGRLSGPVERLVAWLAEQAGLAPAARAAALRAAYLAKADLATRMVYEFPELQGIMGREYARRSGEDEAVALAIYEHYLPRHAGDRLPESPAGMLVALADRMDTLAGCFRLGLVPTGSEDPYGLRRQALGIIRILERWALPLRLRGRDGSPVRAVLLRP